MSLMELKKAELELMRVQAARMELEYKVMEREEDIVRLKQHVQIQLDKEQELKQKLNSLKEEQ